MQLTINPETEALLREHLSSGRFQSPDDLIATALRVLADSTPEDLANLEAAIQEGLDDADRGDLYTEDEARAHLALVRQGLLS